MKRLLVTIIVLITAGRASAVREVYLRSTNAELDAAGCSRLEYFTSGRPWTGISCPAGGDPDFFFMFTLPSWVPDSMQIEDVEIEWVRGTATSGNVCWGFTARVIKTGQNLKTTNLGSSLAGSFTNPLPAENMTQVTTFASEPGMPASLLDAAGNLCSASPNDCRNRTIRVRVNRITALCTNNANGTVQVTGLTIRFKE